MYSGEYGPVQGFEDLNRFVKLGNRSLLIKGKSGTGKVTLALELARNHADKFEIMFISRKMTEYDSMQQVSLGQEPYQTREYFIYVQHGISI